MSDDHQTIPAKCRQCDRPVGDMLVCDYCHSLNPAAMGADHFTLLGLPQQFDLDENVLHERFLALNRHAHPDFHGQETPEVQQLSLRVSAAVNDAYRALKDPASRAEYLLGLMGGKSSAADKSVPDGFLNTMMMMQEELADAKAGGYEDDIRRLRDVLTTQHDGLMRRIAGLFAGLGEAAGCEAVRSDLLGEIRRKLNAVSYVKKLLSQAK